MKMLTAGLVAAATRRTNSEVGSALMHTRVKFGDSTIVFLRRLRLYFSLSIPFPFFPLPRRL